MMEINKMNENNTSNDFRKIKQRELNTNCQYNIPQVNIDKSKLNSNYTHEQLYPQIPLGILNSKFYLIKKLGSGSSGVVFLSYSIEDLNKTLYAIKLIPQTNSNFDLMNSCEVNYLSKLNHKNILKIYSHGTGNVQFQNGLTKQVYYIVMDYLNHGSLLSQVKNNIGLGEDFGRLIFAQLLDGLEAIHDSNIVHRDIKLENIMISGDDYTLKYIDFGFATEKSNGYLTTFLGTPNYAAPELHCKIPYLGVSEDIFSLGVTLFILVTGHLPFLLALPNDMLYRHIYSHDYVNYWIKRNIKVSPSFMKLFDNLIAFDPTQRPSISEIRNSKWMKEINWELKDQLKNELIRREKMNINNENINKNEKKKVDDLLSKIKERKRIEVETEMKKQLFPMNYNNEIKNENNNKPDKTEKSSKNCTNNNLNGFIQINVNNKNMNSLMTLFKGFLKNEGYNITKKDLINSNMEVSNGEVDVNLTFEKMNKIVKVSFYLIKGNQDEFINFKKIMKKIHIKEE